jgi:hypothetical protein
LKVFAKDLYCPQCLPQSDDHYLPAVLISGDLGVHWDTGSLGHLSGAEF